MRTRSQRWWCGGVCVLLSVALCGCGSDDDNTSDDGKSAKPAQESISPADIPLPKYETGTLRVYTEKEGFVVFVDGEPARDADGKLLRTPCRITAIQGGHSILVAKPAYQDASSQVSISGSEGEVVLEPLVDFTNENSLLDAPYWDAEVGKPIALESLNTSAKELDPYITPDGLTLWFVSDRPEGTGIYTASRRSPFHAFEEPELLKLSRGSDLPATPSVTGDSLTVAYALPGKGRVRTLHKTSALGDYDEKPEPIRFTKSDTAFWPVAQILSDGLRLYWTEVDNGKSTTYSSSRKSTDRQFSTTLIVTLPGGFPCMSHDGLRQYAFDGKTLSRARRTLPNVKFSATETIAKLDLSNYVKSADRRQYHVSDDEQWLFYADNPASGGDLHVVRLAEGRLWGYRPTGQSIPPRTIIAEVKPKKKDPGSEDFIPDVFVDPRALPLPYTDHWKQWKELVEARQYAEADKLIRNHDIASEFAKERNLLAWDLQDLTRIRDFWKDVRKGISQLKPGDPFRLRGTQLEFVRSGNDLLVGSLNGKEVSTSIVGLGPVDLLQFADKVIDKTDQAAQLRAGMFLYFDPKGLERSADRRFERSGDSGGEFIERLAGRIFQQAEREFERENYGPGLAFLEQLRKFAPNSDAVGRAEQLEGDLYLRTKWEMVGQRKWKQGPIGEFTAETGRVADSYLISPKRYENFELRMEWKTIQPQPGGGGGVFFRYSRLRGEKPYTADAAFKIQLSNDYGIPADSRCTGALFGEVAPRINAAQPTGKWNSLVLHVIGQKTTVTINNRKVLETTAVNEEIPLKGYIVFDGITGGISYRKVLLMELPSGVPRTSAKR